PRGEAGPRPGGPDRGERQVRRRRPRAEGGAGAVKLPLANLFSGDTDSLKLAILGFGGATLLAGGALAWQWSLYSGYKDALEGARRALAAVASASNQIKNLD